MDSKNTTFLASVQFGMVTLAGLLAGAIYFQDAWAVKASIVALLGGYVCQVATAFMNSGAHRAWCVPAVGGWAVSLLAGGAAALSILF